MNFTTEIIIKSGDNPITSYSSFSEPNAISDIARLDTKSQGAKPFFLGISELGTDTLWDITEKYSGFVSKNFTNEYGVLSLTLLVIGTSAFDNFIIIFDYVSQQWATELTVDGTTYYNDDVNFIWTGTSDTSHTIVIKKWNKPLYPIKVTSILTGISLIFDRSNMKTMVSGSQSMSDNKLPTYGVISQYGSIEAVDKYGKVKELSELRLLKNNLDVIMKIDDTVISKYKTNSWDYTYDNNTINIEFNDELLDWQNIIFEYNNLDLDVTALYVFNKLNTAIGNVITITTEVSDMLEDIKIKYFHISKDSVWNQLNKLCNISQLQIYKNENGDIVAKKYE